MQFLKNTDKTNILNSFYFNFYLRTFLFHKVKKPAFWGGFFDIFKEKSTRPIFHNSAGGTNNA